MLLIAGIMQAEWLFKATDVKGVMVFNILAVRHALLNAWMHAWVHPSNFEGIRPVRKHADTHRPRHRLVIIQGRGSRNRLVITQGRSTGDDSVSGRRGEQRTAPAEGSTFHSYCHIPEVAAQPDVAGQPDIVACQTLDRCCGVSSSCELREALAVI